MDQSKAILLLKVIKFSWYDEPIGKFLFDEHPFEDLSLSSDKDFQKVSAAAGKLGSQRHDEQTILNLLEIAAPVVPFNVVKQLAGKKLTGSKNRKSGKPLKVRGLGSKIPLPEDVTEMLLFPKDGKATDLISPGDVDKKGD